MLRGSRTVVSSTSEVRTVAAGCPTPGCGVDGDRGQPKHEGADDRLDEHGAGESRIWDVPDRWPWATLGEGRAGGGCDEDGPSVARYGITRPVDRAARQSGD